MASIPYVVKSAVNLPTWPNEQYYFQGDQYVRIESIKDECTLGTPRHTWAHWKMLFQVGMQTPDCAFLVDRQSHLAYFIEGDRAILMDIPYDYIKEGGETFRWKQKWTCLNDAGIERIDAAIPEYTADDVPFTQAMWIFSGNKCGLFDLDNNKTITAFDEFSVNLPFLDEVGYTKIDTVCFKPQRDWKEVWFFSGPTYILVDWAGKKWKHDIWSLRVNWKSLKSAGFV